MSVSSRLETAPAGAQEAGKRAGGHPLERQNFGKGEVALAFKSEAEFEAAYAALATQKIRKGSFLPRKDFALSYTDPNGDLLKRSVKLSPKYPGKERVAYGPYRPSHNKYFTHSLEECVAVVARLREEANARPLPQGESFDTFVAHVYLVDPVYGAQVTPVPVYQDLRGAARETSSFAKEPVSPKEMAIAQGEALKRLELLTQLLHAEAEANLEAGRGLRISIDELKEPARRSGAMVRRGVQQQGLLFLPIDLLEPDIPRYSDTKGVSLNLFTIPNGNKIEHAEVIQEASVAKAISCFETAVKKYIESGQGVGIRRRVIPQPVVEFANGKQD